MIFADTTLLIDFLRGKESAVESLRQHKLVFTSEINAFELLVGARLVKHDPEMHEQRALGLLAALNVLPVDRKAALRAARIAADLVKAGKKIEEADCLIAGVALSNGISSVLTANSSHFERIPGLKVVSSTHHRR